MIPQKIITSVGGVEAVKGMLKLGQQGGYTSDNVEQFLFECVSVLSNPCLHCFIGNTVSQDYVLELRQMTA
jgi:hypothetical protein